jgi:hypothetical protein
MSYYEDNLSKWYVSANNKHSTFINQIKDEKLKQQVDTVIETKGFDSTFDTRFDFDVPDVDTEGNDLGTNHNEKFSVWYDPDPSKHKLYRLTPGENAAKGTPQKQNTTPSTGGGFKPNMGERGWFDSKSHDLVTLAVYKEMAAKDFSIRPLTAKEKTPNNYIIKEDGVQVVYLWVGRWQKPNN